MPTKSRLHMMTVLSDPPDASLTPEKSNVALVFPQVKNHPYHLWQLLGSKCVLCVPSQLCQIRQMMHYRATRIMGGP